MRIDFTLKKYRELLWILKEENYRYITFEQYCSNKDVVGNERFVILRHDVDMKAENSLEVAMIEHSLGIKASYYFRVVEQSNRPEIIHRIADLGHEIGYHYEDMSICGGDTEKAIVHFKKQLDYFRKYYPVKTICMHGAPRSKFDGRDLWKRYDYHDYGVIGEPYFDVDFSKVFYLTDTGRRWDGFRVSVRDKVPVYQEEWSEKGWVYHSTDDIIDAVKKGELPECLMMTTHPQRWTDHTFQWAEELMVQRVKNTVKRVIARKK